VLVTQTP